jgi:hypothetical protein
MERLLAALVLSIAISAKDFRCETATLPQKASVSAGSSWTTGNKRVVVLRLEFPGQVEPAPTEQECQGMMDYADRVLRTNSYGVFSLTSTISPLLEMPKPEIDFADRSEIETNAWQLAAQTGIHREDYDLDVIVGTTQWNGEAYGNIGGRGIVMKRAAADSVIVHEFGHNLGLAHANSWVGSDDSICGVGESREYGDGFDIMGSGQRSFNSSAKWRLGWLPPESVQDVTNSQTAEIDFYETATLQPGATNALRIAAGDKTYWIDCQLPTPEAPQLADGILVRWAPAGQTIGSTYLLDMRPETKLFTADAPLLIGRTFSDLKRNVHITPIKKTDNGFSVEVNIGDFSSNHPPELTTTAPDVLQLQIGESFQVSATASDPDGDPVSIFWDFGDGSYGLGATVTNFFVSTGEYSVVCEASDHKGGVTTKSFVARVGSPASYRLSGIVTRNGLPLSDARIYVADQDTPSARTGPDGRYVLTGLFAGSYNLKGSFEGVGLHPVGFQIPYMVSGTQENIDWQYLEISADDLTVDVVEDSEQTPIPLSGQSVFGSMVFHIEKLPQHGVLSGTLAAPRYTPDPNYSGQDSFIYYATYSTNRSLPATVSITVEAQPDLPLVFGRAVGRVESVTMTHFSEPDAKVWIIDACAGNDGRIYTLCSKDRTNTTDLLVRCLDANGYRQWDRVLDFAPLDIADAIFARSDGVVITARTVPTGADPPPAWMVRVGSDSEVKWVCEFANSTIHVTESRGEDAFLVADMRSDSCSVVKIDGATGREVWRKPTVPGFNPNNLDCGEDGQFAVTGWVGLLDVGTEWDCATLKFSSNGDLLWNRSFDKQSTERGLQVHVAADGSVYVVSDGWAGVISVRDYAFWITHYSKTGGDLWQSEPMLNVGPLVAFDRNGVPNVLTTVQPSIPTRSVLLRFETRTPERLWASSTNAGARSPFGLHLTRSGVFEAFTTDLRDGFSTEWLTTISSTGAELSDVPLRYGGSRWPPALLRPGSSDQSFLVIGAYRGDVRDFDAPTGMAKFINETVPQTIVLQRGQSLVSWASPVSLDGKPLVMKATALPMHGTLTGAWPNWIYSPAPDYVGEDRIGFKVSQPGEEAIDGEFRINVVAPLDLRLEQATPGAVTLTADPSAPVSWSRDSKEWTPLRGNFPQH